MVVDPPETNRALIEHKGLEFPIFSDAGFALIDAFGLRHREGHEGQDIALSASVLLDPNGVVRWASVTRNLRVRPTPETTLAAIDASGVTRATTGDTMNQALPHS